MLNFVQRDEMNVDIKKPSNQTEFGGKVYFYFYVGLHVARVAR